MQLNIFFITAEKYSRGRRGAPAKGVGRATGARVQIPLSPFLFLKKARKNKIKKLLTSKNAYDRIYELSLRQQRTLKTEQYVKP